jgi:hypothetical protein
MHVFDRAGDTANGFVGCRGPIGWFGRFDAPFALRGVDSTADACSKAAVRSSVTRMLADVQEPN